MDNGKEVDDLTSDVGGTIRADEDKAPAALRALSEDELREVVAYVIDKMEALGVDPRAEYADLNDDDDDDDFDDEDDDDDFDDDELDDSWPGDSDDDEE